MSFSDNFQNNCLNHESLKLLAAKRHSISFRQVYTQKHVLALLKLRPLIIILYAMTKHASEATRFRLYVNCILNVYLCIKTPSGISYDKLNVPQFLTDTVIRLAEESSQTARDIG